MMQLGVVTKEGSENFEIESGHLTFDSGKKVILTAEEVEEVKTKIRVYKAHAIIELEHQTAKALEPLTLLLDWYNEAPIDELEAVEKSIGFNFPYTELVNALHIIFKKDQGTLQQESLKRIKTVALDRMKE